MNSTGLEGLKYRGRVTVGACLHAVGLYRRLLPVFERSPSEPLRRLQAYLNHYYEQVEHAEAELYLEGLGLTVACDIKDHMLWRHLEGLAPIYEQTDIDHCRALVEPTDRIFDVGANHGFWGFSLARKAGPHARLYLAEPNPTILRRLKRTLVLNPVIDALILPWAITDGADAEVTFYLPVGNLSGLGSTVLHPTATQRGYLEADRRTTVAATSVDDLVAEGLIAGVDVMKIDVEHGEDAVIRGALATLERFRPRLVMMETAPDSYAATTLAALGYDSYCLDAQGGRKPVDPGFWGNIFFVPHPR